MKEVEATELDLLRLSNPLQKEERDREEDFSTDLRLLLKQIPLRRSKESLEVSLQERRLRR
jgi:hypothetical protein